MSENLNFSIKVKNFIEDIYNKIEEQDSDFQADLEYTNEVLTIDIDGKIFVINKQTPLEEIWLASPLSGPYHFKEIEGTWKDSKGNIMIDILSDELSELLEMDIIL